jgi:dTDP-4-dehydrorhamnose reductase
MRRGYTGKPNVDASEQQKLTCIEANLTLPGIISEVCAQHGIPWGHVSSGCIFTGRRDDGGGFTEEDQPNFDFRHDNCSFYSGTKALAEEILADSGDHYIWRLRIPFNEVDSPRNYLSKLMHYEYLIDVENSISQLDEFVRACWKCWEKQVPYGTYNVTNPGVVTTREVAEMISAHGFCKDKEWKFFKDEEEFLEKAAKTPPLESPNGINLR